MRLLATLLASMASLIIAPIVLFASLSRLREAERTMGTGMGRLAGNLVPRVFVPVDQRSENGIDADCAVTAWAEFGYFLCYFKRFLPESLVFRPLVKGNEDSGNEIGWPGKELGTCSLFGQRILNCFGSVWYSRHHSVT